jgi:hypothetical protein
MPYHAPIYVMPEFPFDITSKIRAVFQGKREIENLVEPYNSNTASDKSGGF